MPKSIVTEQPAEDRRPVADQASAARLAAGLAVVTAPRTLRLARRHPLSKARGILLGVLLGLMVWTLVAALLYTRL